MHKKKLFLKTVLISLICLQNLFAPTLTYAPIEKKPKRVRICVQPKIIGFDTFEKIMLEGTLARVPFKNRLSIEKTIKEWFVSTDNHIEKVASCEQRIHFIKMEQVDGRSLIEVLDFLNIIEINTISSGKEYLLIAYNKGSKSIRVIGIVRDFTKTPDRLRETFNVLIECPNGTLLSGLLCPIGFGL